MTIIKNWFTLLKSEENIYIFNAKIGYYALRIAAILWLIKLYSDFLKLSNQHKELYSPSVVAKTLFPEFPTVLQFSIIYGVAFLCLILSIFKHHISLNILIFILLAVLNIPVMGFYGGFGHSNHLLIIGFFLLIFWIPSKINFEQVKYVPYAYIGVMIPYFFSGIWKCLATAKNKLLQTGHITWIDKDADFYNTAVQWRNFNDIPSDFFHSFYEIWQIHWLIIVLGILYMLFLPFTAYRRKWLTISLIFLVGFTLHNTIFVTANFNMAMIVHIALLFPYHVFRIKI